MRRDRRPVWLKNFYSELSRMWARHYLHPQFDALGEGVEFINPKSVEVVGANIRIGRRVHMMATADNPIRFNVYPVSETKGAITVGNYCIILPGVRLASAEHIIVGDNCMIASNSYVSDADWHDVYDRTWAPGKSAPVVLEENVWLCERSLVGKGVRIGENSIVGAGAVVTKDVPPNCIVAGNPARIVKQLDPERGFKMRQSLFEGMNQPYDDWIRGFDRWVLGPNTFWDYLRARYAPTRRH